MPLTDNPDDPRLGYGVDDRPGPQQDAYLVLSDTEKAKGYIRPIRATYIHRACGQATTMSPGLAETYAREPQFYGSTYCTGCRMHLAIHEFEWMDGTTVGS